MKKYRLIFAVIVLLMLSIAMSACGGRNIELLMNTDGGSGDGDTTLLSEGTVLPTPEKPGFSFKGWYADETLNTPYTYEVLSRDAKFGDKKVVYADWEAINFTITYLLNGGENNINNPETFTVENTEIILLTPSRAGYTFGGWYENEVFSGSAVTVIASGSIGDKTLYAKWLPYDIKYYLNGGQNNALNSPTYDGTQEVTLYAPTKVGYNFDGWYDNATFSGGIIELLPIGSTRNKEFYAKWSIISYTISYDLKGGSNDSNNVATYNISQNITLHPAVRSGYDFEGWYLPSGTLLAAIPQGTINNIQLEAKWTASSYDITYILGGGTNDAQNKTTFTVLDSFSLLPATRTGYYFAGWTDSENNAVTDVAKGSFGNKVFYANWQVIPYNIVYFLDGGTAANPAVYNITSDITLSAATKAGYTFKGWYTAANFAPETAITKLPLTGVLEDINIYARFINQYSITYNLLNGTNNELNLTNFTEEDSVLFYAPSKTGYTFGGWYLEDTFTTVVTQIAVGTTSNLTLYAKWNAINYNINYNLNGGTQVPQNPVSYIIEDALAFTAPTRNGYTFSGWFNNVALSGTAITNLPKGTINDIQLYAKWTAASYTITYMLDGGVNNPSNRTVYTLNDSFSFAPATKNGYTFDGWYSESTFQNRITGINTNTTGAKTFYAKFLVLYTITYELFGGQNGANPAGYTGLTTVSLNAPAKAGHRFMGWYDNGSFSGAIITSIPEGSSGNRKVYARFLMEYSVTYHLDSGINSITNPSKFIVNDVFTFEYPTKNGYNFLGWFTDTEFTIPIEGVTNGTKNITVYAKWQIINYTIDYQLDGGVNNSQNPLTYFVSATVSLFPATRSGFTFIGWYDNAGFSGIPVTTLGSGGTGNKILYAKFLTVYAITYELDGGENNGENPIVYNEESNIILLSATKLGYEFSSWLLNGQPIATISGRTGDIVLTATYAAINYNITYITYGGSTTSPSTYTVEGRTLLSAQKTHYVFENWYRNAEFSEEPVTEILAGETGDLTLHAKYHAYAYGISYTLNGGVNNQSNPSNFTVLEDIILKDPLKNEYVFLGWYDNAVFSGTAVTQFSVGTSGNKQLYAKWQVKVYSIAYMLGGGTNNASNVGSYTTENTVTLYPATRSQYTFGGWYDHDTKGISSERLTADGILPITNISTGSVGNRVFYARWISAQYTITYELSGGVNNTNNPATYNRDSEIIFLAPSKTNYSFNGWFDNASFVGQPITRINLGTTGNKVFYARFSLTYKINYLVDGATFNPEPSSYTALDAITLGIPQKASHVFMGWFDNATFLGNAITEIPLGSSGDKEFHAKFLQLYQVVYYLNSGTNNQFNPTAYTKDQSFEIHPATRHGYIFVGWFATPDFSGAPKTEITVGSTGSLTLHAKFLYVNEVGYITNGGTNSLNNPSQYTSEDDIILAAATRTGYTFMGWYDNANFIGNAIERLNAATSGTRNLYAKWDIIIYTVTYVLNAGQNSQNPTTYDVTTAAITLQNANRINYLFKGWYDNEQLTGTSIPTIPLGSIGNRTLYAKWQAIEFNITYNLGGGTNAAANPSKYTVLSPDIVFESPTREGATFQSWYDNASFSGSPVTRIASGSVGNRTYFAKWQLENYGITYSLDGGTNSQQNPTLYNVGSTVALYSPVKAYNSFLGWYDNAAFSGEKLTEISGRIGALTLYARFSTTYFVNYSLNGGAQSPDNAVNFTEHSPTIALVAPTRPNYTFVGWYGAADSSGSAITEITQGTTTSINLYAKWAPGVFNINYNLNGGTNGANPSQFTIETPNISFAPATRSGFTFDGWYDNAQFGGISIGTLPYGSSGNKEFYAKWNVITYTITYELNQGNNSPYNPASYTVLNTNIVLASPLRNYYNFSGWYANADFSGTAITTIASGSTGNRELYAKWTAIRYDIIYHISGGQNGAGNPYEYTYADTITLNDPIRANFIFLDWYTNSQYSGSPIDVISQRSGTLNLYAKWQAVTYDIVYNLNGGSNPLNNPSKYNVESNIHLLNATRANHNFLGWYRTSDFSDEAVTDILPGTSGNIMLYAKFLPSYSITYYLNEGTNSPSNPASYTDIDEITLAAPIRPNYIFIAWYDNAAFDGEAVTGISAGSLGAKVFYAKFLFAYKITYYLNGGQNDSANPSYYLEDMTINLNEPYKSGYVFMGWYDNATFSGEPVTIISGSQKINKNLYAWWGVWDNFMYYGEYPQTRLTDSATLTALSDGIVDNSITADTQGYYAYGGERYAKYLSTESQNGYYQGETYYFKVEPIKWRILFHEGKEATVISEVILDSMAYNTISQSLWASSSLRAWLNDDFYNDTFVSADNHYHIVETQTISSQNPVHGSNSGIAAQDYVALLSIASVTNFEYGFSAQLSEEDSNRIALNTEYAKARGAYTDGEGEGAWWLYTPGSNNYYASYVGSDGKVYANGNNVTLSYFGIRPVMRLSLGAI